MKPWPEHHKRVRLPFAVVEHGYDGNFQIRQAGPGWWQIIGADMSPTNSAPHPSPSGMIRLIVAPAPTRGDASDRMALILRGIATGDPAMARARVLADNVGADGECRRMGPTPPFAEMDLADLRALVETLEARASRRKKAGR